MESGERYCLLLDEWSGIPLYYPNLYITTQVRNKSLSYSAMESTLGGISVLMRFMDDRDEEIEKRFRKGDFFEESELDAIRDYCQKKLHSGTPVSYPIGLINFSKLRDVDETVSAETEYIRLTVIAHYTKWLAEQLKTSQKDKLQTLLISKMEKGFKSRRPIKKKRNKGNDEKGLTQEQLDLLFELFRPDSDLNPFKDKSVRIRNRLIFLMLYHLGLRGGELLNIRISDIDFTRNQLIIARRADEKSDPRKYQPLVKTLDRRLPVKETLIKELHQYISIERKVVSNAGKNDYLFITHKSGPTQGQPLSKSGYKKIIDVVRKTSPSLFNLTGHQLRHSWNEAFSEHMDSMDEAPSQEQQEKMRSYLMGWKEGSGTAQIYNKRFVRNKANYAALKLQESMTRLPKGIKHE